MPVPICTNVERQKLFYFLHAFCWIEVLWFLLTKTKADSFRDKKGKNYKKNSEHLLKILV